MMQTELLMVAQTGASSLINVLPLVGMFAIIYFILIVPQRRQVKAHRALVEGLQKGDEVVTAGGLVGEITGIKDDVVQLRTGQSSVVVERSRIMSRRSAAGVPAEKTDKK
jgi:preprotein translocase subunit YajC